MSEIKTYVPAALSEQAKYPKNELEALSAIAQALCLIAEKLDDLADAVA